jgi:hypothetical protein
LELDVGEEALRELFAHPSTARDGHTDEGTGVDDVEHRRARWGLWYRRETEFFERAAQIAAPLRWEDVERLGGVELRARVALVRSARRALAETSLPAALEFAPLRIERTTGERVRVVTYSAFDPLEVPARLLALLPVFDGSPLAQVRCKLKDEHGIELDDSLIRRMIDFELLVEARLMNSPAAGTD